MNRVNEKPILFSGPMVRAIMDGRKTQTRRVVNTGRFDQIHWDLSLVEGSLIRHSKTGIVFNTPGGGLAKSMQDRVVRCPYGKPGDGLWVRETFYQPADGYMDASSEWVHTWIRSKSQLVYAADQEAVDTSWKSTPFKHCLLKRPSIHMPRWASRLNLGVLNIRAERLQDITETDALKEGFETSPCAACDERGYWANESEICEDCAGDGWHSARQNFIATWDSLNADRGYSWSVNPWVWAIEFKRI